jgi:hypothetical protein
MQIYHTKLLSIQKQKFKSKSHLNKTLNIIPQFIKDNIFSMKNNHALFLMVSKNIQELLKRIRKIEQSTTVSSKDRTCS